MSTNFQQNIRIDNPNWTARNTGTKVLRFKIIRKIQQQRWRFKVHFQFVCWQLLNGPVLWWLILFLFITLENGWVINCRHFLCIVYCLKSKYLNVELYIRSSYFVIKFVSFVLLLNEVQRWKQKKEGKKRTTCL